MSMPCRHSHTGLASAAVQLLFRILTLIALMVAPLAAPATAMAPVNAAADCKAMDMGAAQHSMPAGHHSMGEPCCIAVPLAIDSPFVAIAVAPLVDHPAFVAVAEAFRLGAGPSAEDPPPRSA